MSDKEIEIGPQNMSLLRRGTRKFISQKTIKSIPDVLNSMAEKIILLYPKGIYSIFDTPEPKENEVYKTLIFNTNERFYKKFYTKMKKISNIIDTGIPLNEIPQDSIFNNNKKENNNNIINKLNESTNSDYLNSNYYNLNPTQNEIYNRIQDNNQFRNLVKKVLSEVQKSNELLLETVLNKYAEYNSNKLKESHPEYFAKCTKIYVTCNPDNTNSTYLPYYEFHYEDFILIFCSVIRYFTGLNIKIEISDSAPKKILLIIYGNEDNYETFAEFFGFELQLKPYASKYDIYVNKELRKNSLMDSKKSLSYEERLSLSRLNSLEISLITQKSDLNKSYQFWEFSQNDQTAFPPYMPFEKVKKLKFRTYERNDNYHDCENDPDFHKGINSCAHDISIFRNIDKLRLINKALELLFNNNTLIKYNILWMIVYKRNYISYGDKLLTQSLFNDTSKIFSKHHVYRLVNTIRNYFGEYISFYFLWCTSFCNWMILPSLIGFLVFIVGANQDEILQNYEIKTIKKLTLNTYDIFLIILCIFITIWAMLFLKVWRQNEQLFSYFWGMENYEKIEPLNGNFTPNKTYDFLFGEKIKVFSTVSSNFRRFVSYIVLGMMIIIRLVSVHYIYKIKNKEKYSQSLKWNIIFGCITGLTLKLMSILYEFIAKLFCEWENYEKLSQKQNALALKLILFEFVNNYSTLFYIAFYKTYSKQKCFYDNCFQELEIQLYLLLIINFSFNLYEIFYPLIMYQIRLRRINKHPLFQPKKHSIEHQILSNECYTLIYDYNKRLILFGFVCLFSVAAPLTPIISLILSYLEIYVDVYKIFNLNRIDIIEGASGIDIYNSILKMFYFIGMLTSVALILFSNPHLLNLKYYVDFSILKNKDFINKFILFAIIENVILFIMNTFNYNDLPYWFNYLSEYKSIYTKKYFNRDYKNLPHMIYTEENKNNE